MKRLSWLYILLMLVGCAESSIEDNSVIASGSEEFYATMEGADSRTYVDGQIRMRWHADDRITIFKKETYNREFKFAGKTGANAGGFKQVSVDDDFYFGYPVNANYAVYPHSTDTELDETDCFFTLTMPAEQTYAENSFGLNANTMVAVSETGNLMFKNVGCYLRVRLYGENTTISSVTLSTKGDEAIAGEAKVTPFMDGNPTCEMTGTGKSIRLICETPVAISSNADTPTDFWIVVPPVTLADGFSVTVENENDNAQVYDVNQSFTFERNKYYDMVREVEIEDIKTIHVATAGTLPTLISEEEKDGITSLKLTGDLNGTDFKFIREMVLSSFEAYGANGITHLDLSDANIIEGGEAYFDNYSTKTNTLTDFMFAGFNLQKIIMPNSLTTIGGGAFFASNIKSITIPKNVSNISEQAFVTKKMVEIIVDPENTVYDSRDNCNAIIETETNTLIAGCETSVIPNGVTSIGSYAFENCSSLTSVTIPNSVTSIESSAFSGCSSLTSIAIPNSVTSIGNEAFRRCSSLTSVAIGNGVTSIVGSPFSECFSLTSVYISDLSAWCKIEFGSIYSNPLEKGAKLYLNGSLLTELVIPEDVEEIKDYAFYKYSSLTSVTIGDGVTSIGICAFRNCSSLISATIGDGVTSIGADAFYNCSSLTSVTIPNSVTSIDYGSFEGCSALVSVYISDLSAWCKIDYNDGFGRGTNPLNNGAKLYLNSNLLTELVIPEDVEEIKDFAFYKCSSLTSVTIPNGVTSIGQSAFYGCNALASVTIGNGVTSVGFYAFQHCSALTQLYCYATTPPNCETHALDDINNNVTLFVSKGCKSAYESASGWSKFTNIIEMD